MKYILIVPDGAADRPVPELGNKTPLQAAKKPHLDQLAKLGQVGMVKTCPEKFEAGSDVGNLCLLGYEPEKFFTGRSPLEASNIGVDLKSNQVAFRCNLVTVKDGTMVDYSASHITTPEAKPLIDMLNKRLGNKKIKFYTGTSYRHLLVWEGASDQVKATPPHNITGQPYEEFLPKGRGEKNIRQLMADSQLLLEGHEVNWRRRQEKLNTANMIWLWGQGKKPTLPSFNEKYKLSGAVISAVDLVKGMALYANLRNINVPGATGYFDTDYKAKGEYALKALKKDDFLMIHIEATDEAGHIGSAAEKVKAIEQIDEKIIGPLLEGLKTMGDYRILVSPDHPTPVSTKMHNHEKVPFLICGSGITPDAVTSYDEQAALSGSLQVEEGWRLMDLLIKGAL